MTNANHELVWREACDALRKAIDSLTEVQQTSDHVEAQVINATVFNANKALAYADQWIREEYSQNKN